jgi:phage protein U
MANVLLGLGPYRFAVMQMCHNQLTRRFEYRWEAQPSIGRWPVWAVQEPAPPAAQPRATLTQ